MGVFHDFHACISLKKVLDATIIAGLLILRVFYGFFSSFLGCNQVRHYGVFYDFHACISLKKVLNAIIIAGLLILRTSGILVLWVEFIRLLPKLCQ
jgi:hypothetical protein